MIYLRRQIRAVWHVLSWKHGNPCFRVDLVEDFFTLRSPSQCNPINSSWTSTMIVNELVSWIAVAFKLYLTTIISSAQS